MLDSRAARPKTRVRRSGAVTTVIPAKRKPGASAPQALARRAASAPHRPVTLLVIMVLMAAGIASRLAFWQVLQHGYLYTMAVSERAGLQSQPAARGVITDADGSPMAMNVNL